MATVDTAQIRADLERELADLRGRVAGLTNNGSAAPEFDEGFADSAQVAAEQGENLTLAAGMRELLDDVEHALARLDDGSYGTCERCGAAISAARLQAMPATRFCIDHA